MTTDLINDIVKVLVQGTGPYQIRDPYDNPSDISVFVRQSAQDDFVALSINAQFTVSPQSSETTGDVFLLASTAAAYEGSELVVVRASRIEQGYKAQSGPRDKGLEAQLNRTTRALQDVELTQRRTILAPLGDTDTPLLVDLPEEGRALVARPDGKGWTNGPQAQTKDQSDAAVAAAEASAARAEGAANVSGDFEIYPTYAAANAAAGGLDEGQIVEVTQDETLLNRRTRYVVQGGALDFQFSFVSRSEIDGLHLPVTNYAALSALTYATAPIGRTVQDQQTNALYIVVDPAAPGDPDIYEDFTGAGGVKLFAQPVSGAVPLEMFGVDENASDNITALRRAAAWASSFYSRANGERPQLGGRVVGKPGAQYRFSGRLRIPSGMFLDLGNNVSGATLVCTSTTGGVELEAAAQLKGGIGVDNATYTGPMLELNDEKTTERFNMAERETAFDVWLHAGRQAGSVGILMQSSLTGVAGGVAWVKGRAVVQECDFTLRAVSNAQGYVNSNEIEIESFDAVEHFDIAVNGTGEVTANRLTLTSQTGIVDRSGRVLRCDGTENYIYLKSWDWTEDRQNPAYDGTQVVLTDKSGGNRLCGSVRRPDAFGPPPYVDLSPMVRRNIVELDDLRVIAPAARSIVPATYLNTVGLPEINDELAYAPFRWTVTGGGVTPPDITSLQRLFAPDGNRLSVSNATEVIVTVDFGSQKTGSDYNAVGLAFYGATSKPDKCKIEFSTDGSTWNTQIECGYNGELMPNTLERCDSSLSNVRYARVVAENDSPKTLTIGRFFLYGHGTSTTGGSLAARSYPDFFGPIDIISDGVQRGVRVDGVRVVNQRQPAIADSAGGDEQSKINSILSAMRTHGLIES